MKKKKTQQTKEDWSDSYDYLANSASANDCTGLIPSAPQSRAELDSYQDVYAFTPSFLSSHPISKNTQKK